MKIVKIVFLIAVLVPILECLSHSQELGYRRITMEKKIKEFYKDGGRKYLGKKIHILIPASVFKKKAETLIRPNRVRWHLFKNQSVPVMISPANQYYKRLQNALAKEKKRKKKKIALVSVYGRVVRPSWDIKGRCYLLVYKMKSYGGALTKIGG